MRFAALSATAAAAAALLTGCMGGAAPQYDASAYRPGDCRTASAPVFEIDAAVRPVLGEGGAPADAAAELKMSQQALISTMSALRDADVRADAQRVVDAVGFYRIGVDAKNFTPKLAKDVRTASQSLLTACSV